MMIMLISLSALKLLSSIFFLMRKRIPGVDTGGGVLSPAGTEPRKEAA